MPERASRKGGLLVGLVLAVITLVGGGWLFLALVKSDEAAVVVVKPQPKARPGKSPTPPPNAVPTSVVVTLRAEPSATRFEVNGEKLDGNPLTLKRAKGSDVTVVASAQGFEPKSLKLSFDEAHEERVTLTRAAARPVTKPPPPPAPGKKPGKLTVDETNPYE